MSSVAGLRAATKLYESDKVKERAEGGDRLRDIFSSRDSLTAFQESLSKDGGGGWVALFQCLFQVVLKEKKAALKSSATAQADRRLGDAINLVRFVAERSVHSLSRKPFLALFRHLSTLLVHHSAIFAPAALDYAKALKTLLSYRPHLETLDKLMWRNLLGICWSAFFEDAILVEADWNDEGLANGENEDEIEVDEDIPPSTAARASTKPKTITSANNELLSLIPILLSSSTAPIIPPFPTSESPVPPPASIGMWCLMKIHRYLTHAPSEATGLLPILRSLNLILGELELNSRNEFISAGLKLIGPLVALWGQKNKAIREQLVMALRTFMPSLCHPSLPSEDRSVVVDALEKLLESLPKESTWHWGLEPLNLAVVRFVEPNLEEGTQRRPYEAGCMTAGFDFTHEIALAWTTIELYAACIHGLHVSQSTSLPPSGSARQNKRRRVEDSMSTVIALLNMGSANSRTLACQVLLMLVSNHDLDPSVRSRVRQALIEALDDESAQTQSWAFVALAVLAETSAPDHHISNHSDSARRAEMDDWTRVWTYATRKLAIPATCRAACHAAHTLLRLQSIDDVRISQDISAILRQIEVQGPSFPFDSVCAFLSSAVRHARADVRLYSLNLENNVLLWLEKWNVLEGTRGKARMDPQSPSDVLRLLNAICNIEHQSLTYRRTVDFLPDCAIVEKVLQEAMTEPIRAFIQDGRVPSLPSGKKSGSPRARGIAQGTEEPLTGCSKKVSALLTATADQFISDWSGSENLATSPPERARRAIDFIVLCLALQASLKLEGFQIDDSLLERVAKLFELVMPTLSSLAIAKPAQFLLWRGLRPLLSVAESDDPLWRILVKPDPTSGIRPDLLPSKDHGSTSTQDEEEQDELPLAMWSLPFMETPSRSLVQLAKQLMDPGDPFSNPSSGLPSTQAITLPSGDDDDFGAIRTSDSDAMPLSQEGIDCQRTTNGLLDILTATRTRGTALLSGSTSAVRDISLLNTLLSSEGPRVVQLGNAICSAVSNDLIALAPSAVSMILEFFEEFTSSYGYQRDGSFFSLILRFLTCSAPVWLSDSVSGSELPEQAMTLAKHIIARCLSETPPSWQVRLDVLVFLDEYLDYDPEFNLWKEIEVEALTSTEGEWGPMASIASGLVDKDARVRFRAATSTATLFTLPAMTPDRQLTFYLLAMEQQPRQPAYWDSFLTDMLFKLNACVAAVGTRHAALYHLYEIPLSGSTFDRHLESALKASASRLGLGGVAPLFETYSRVIVSSLLDAHQTLLALPPALCGYSDTTSMAKAILKQCGAMLVANHQFDNLKLLCSETGESVADVVLSNIYPASAQVVCRHVAAVRELGKKQPSKQVSASIASELKDWPRIKGGEKLSEIVTRERSSIATELFGILDKNDTNDAIGSALHGFDPSAAAVFKSLVALSPNVDPNPDVTSTSQPIENIAAALAYLREGDAEFSTTSVAMNALIELMDSIHTSILSSSRTHLLRSVALVAAVFHQDFKDVRLLQYFLDEIIALLPQVDLFEPAFEMLRWAFSYVSEASEAPPRFRDIVLRLGTARTSLSTEPRRELDQWIKGKLPQWTKASHMRDALDAGYILWSRSADVFPSDWAPPLFESVTELLSIASESDAMALCQYIHSHISATNPSEDDLEIARSAFWHLKPKLSKSDWTEDGASAFVGLLALTEGHVQGPSMELAENASPTTAKLAARLKNEPPTLVWILVLQALLKMTTSEEYSTRSIGYKILRPLRDGVKAVIDRGLLPSNETLVIDILRSPSPSLAISASQVSLGDLAEADSFQSNMSHFDIWSCDLASILVRVLADWDTSFAYLSPLTISSKHASAFLPLLVQAVLSCSSSKDDATLKERCKQLSTYFSTVLENPAASESVIQSILGIMLHLRHFQPPYRKDVLGFNHWLEVDLLLASESAVRIKAYATALLLLEIAISNVEGDKPDLFNHRVQSIMFAVYSNVEDPDGFYGIKTHNVKEALNRRIDHEGLYVRALGLNGAMLQANGAGVTPLPALQSLHHIGLDKLASLLMKPVLGTHEAAAPEDPIFFELAWRTSDCELPVSADASATSAGSFYGAIRAIHRERDQSAARAAVVTSLKEEMLRLKDLGMERMVEIRRSAANLVCLEDVHHWLSSSTQQAIEENDFGSGAIMHFAGLSPSMEFSLAERLTATRLSILQAAQIKEGQKVIGNLTTPQSDGFKLLQKACHLKFGSKARAEGKQQAAINSIAAVQVLEEGETASAAALDEFNEVLWMQQEHALAIQQLQEMIDPLDKEEKKDVYRLAVLLARKAHWASLAKQLSPHETHQIFDRATRLSLKSTSGNREHREDIADIAFQYAQFADHHQATIHTAPDLHRLREWRTRKKGELSQLDESLKKKKDETTKSVRAERLAELVEDEKAIRELETEHELFVRHAVRQYAVCLGHSDRHNDAVTRLVSMWFQFGPPRNNSKEELKRVDQLFQYYAGPLDRCPTHKFLFLGPQLAARLYRPASGESKFYTALHGLLLKLSKQHPYHILYSIIPLAFGINIANGSRRASELPEGRGPAAAEILQILSVDRENTKARTAAAQMSQFHDAAMMWCNHKGDDKAKSKRLTVPSNQPIAKISRMAIPIATVTPPIDLTMEYANLPTLKQYKAEYILLGGLHRPKKMTAVDSLGKSHYQLFKGDDEIRQDAVMEQVFEMTNKTLARDRKTKERNLKYRTYLVIPLAERTGILEFVGGGLSIGDWLRPAHDRYRKDTEITGDEIRNTIKKLQEKDHTDPKIVEAFVGYMKRFRPVMRHFFTEKHKNPTAWFTMRLNYSRSVAVTSMVGHILGIGDRHLSNIMIDQVTGEVIHIDFGIVFEDGERLRVPEKVPFRLTNDMVDGLGITGVEGTFRRCSEHTLRVLRSNAELIMTVLEVFKHDPLYAWNGDPERMQRAQGGARSDLLQNTASVQEKADRVLVRIRHKLRDDLSVEYAVNQLVQQARDPENLAKIFHGWHPWI